MKKAILTVTTLLVLILSACGSSSTPEAIPTIVLDGGNTTDNTPRTASSGGDIIASAVVTPAQEAHLAFNGGGTVVKVNAGVGDRVSAGFILVELDHTLAQLELERAQRALRELTSPAMIAAAGEALATAQKELEDAETDVEGLLYPRASDTLIDNVKGEIDLAEKQLALASDAYRLVAKRPDGDPKKAAALVAMTNAQLNLNTLQARYNWYTGKPSETDAAITQAKYEAAKAAYQEAEWYLVALKGEPIPPDASGAKLAQLQQANADVIAAQNRLDQSRLAAPIPGTVAELNVIAGEFATPGMTLVVISNTDQFQVRTTDLSERDIINVKIGDPAVITVDALNEEFGGKVIAISPTADTLGGDVVYEVTIEFDEQPAGVLGGMTAEVAIGG